jgi:hypothetical protein
MSTKSNMTQLSIAADKVEAGLSKHAISGLSDEAYEIATRVSERFFGVGLTGLAEDAARNDCRDDLISALRIAAREA